MQLQDFQYDLPPELIARYPISPRTASRLLSLNKLTGEYQHRQFTDLPNLLKPGDLLVFNDTRVIPARLFGQKTTGGKVEILIERILDDQRALAQIKASKRPKIGSKITLEKEIVVEILGWQNDLYEVSFPPSKFSPANGGGVLEILNEIGHIPVPPYFNRPDESIDNDRYQTVYAKNPGAVAAPTAGLHFDEILIKQLQLQGVEIAFITLHVGAGTFQPVRTENIKDHVMHAEYALISPEICQKIQQTKQMGKRVIAVGTTAVRTLETASQHGMIQPFQGNTNIFIYPGYQFKCVDAMITNFHLPQSTLLMLVCAFAGHEIMLDAYREAIANSYRFYSYGDAMWIE